MKISFLVTYYNQKEFVKQSLDSILAVEKSCDWEILVGDDGSNDGTIDEVNRYIERYPNNIKLYVMPREDGKKYDSVKRASSNRINLLEHMTGDIFCTLDGDDYYCDTKFINDAADIFKENKDVSIIAFGYKYVTDGVYREQSTLPAGAANKRVDKKTYLEGFYLPAGACVHRKCFNKDRIEFIRKLGYFDDNNIAVNSLNYGEMYAVNRAIYAYRQTGQSVYTSMDELEQAVLNVQGLDVDIRLSNDAIQEYIKKRYASAAILMYIWRKKIREILGEERCKKYEVGCKNLIPSFCYDLLNYSELSNERKKELKLFLNLNKKYALKQYAKYYLRGIVG